MKPLRLICALFVLTAGIPSIGSAVDNEAPLADAGLDQSVSEGSIVYLDGGGALDPDGSIVEYSWSIQTPRGSSMEPTNPHAELTRFVANSAGRYSVTLTVTDDDGSTKSDTLYVDVTDSSPVAPPSGPSSPQAPPQLNVGGPISNGPAVNQAPHGQIFGPSSVKAGRVGRYSLQATDSDGHITDYWWSPPTAFENHQLDSDVHTVGRSYSFDVEPGTTVEIPAYVVDNDGDRSRISKTVEVTNNLPTASLVGNGTVVVGSVHRYEAVASDPDGRITGYDWETDSGVERVNTGGMVGGSSGSATSTLVRFTEIPQDDATASVGVTVRDEHGGEKSVEKGVTVVRTSEDEKLGDVNKYPPTVERLTGTTVPGSKSAFSSAGVSNHHKFSFTAIAKDNDSKRLIYNWKFGERGTARTVETDHYSKSTVTFIFENQGALSENIEISVQVKDQTGRTDTKMRTMVLNVGGASRTDRRDLNIKNNGDGQISGTVIVSDGTNHDHSPIEVTFGDGTQSEFPIENLPTGQLGARFDHRYNFGGKYTVYVFDSGDQSVSYGREKVVIDKRTYVLYSFERRANIVQRTLAKERPGSRWNRGDVDHVEQSYVKTLQTSTPIVGKSALKPGPAWVRVGTNVEYRTEFQTKRAIESPGSSWNITKKSVEQRRVVDRWKSVTVSRRGLADSSWQYVQIVPKTVNTTQTKKATHRPEGDAWDRLGRTGEHSIIGHDYEWVSSRYYADSDWDYIRSDRYLDYWHTDSHCAEYGNFGGFRYCIREKTTRTPVYDHRYLYKVPDYDPVYEWERTVEHTVYEHKYQYPVYKLENVNEYQKKVQVPKRLATWKKDVYSLEKVYSWTKTKQEWRKETSLTRPKGVRVKNITSTVKDCGEVWNAGEPAICGSVSGK